MKQPILIFNALFATLTLLTGCTVPVSTGSFGDIGVVAQPVPVPVVINVHTDSSNNKKDNTEKKEDVVYMCKLNAFTSAYQAEDTNRGKARLNVKKQCLNNFHEMFCRDEDISCIEYN